MKNLLTWIWCFPQMLLGWIVKKVTKAEKADGYYKWNNPLGSVSLGIYIFLCEGHWGNKTVLKHEQGHMKQSYILGWLYLFVIGLPSLVWCNCFNWYRRKYNVSYYDFYTEKWADRLGGVER